MEKPLLYIDVSTIKKDKDGNPIDGTGRVYTFKDEKFRDIMFKNVNVAKNFQLLEVVEEPIKTKQQDEILPINPIPETVDNIGVNVENIDVPDIREVKKRGRKAKTI